MIRDKCAIVIDSDVLRKSGALITNGISWERTALNTIWQFVSNEYFRPLRRAEMIIVILGLEGALVFNNNNQSCTLWYNPKKMEGDTNASIGGSVPEAWEVMLAWMIKEFHEGVRVGKPWERLESSVGAALSAASKAFASGYKMDKAKYSINLSHHDTLFQDPSGFIKTIVPSQAGTEKWRIAQSELENYSNESFEETIKRVVIEGYKIDIMNCPILTIGKLITADRFEIEGFMDIKSLIKEYAVVDKPSRPLCLAVFGKPGSGKSFGITEIAENVLPKQIKRLEFNVSQFNNVHDLNVAFHQVRDVVLSGQIPLVFFDEFDSDDLKWL